MTWKSYEALTQTVFQSILDQKQFPNLKVEHDVQLQGKTITHQIDVHWKFEVAGIPHEVVVQVKDWRNPVSVGEMLKFKAVLDDLPGQPVGVFVAKSGYQSGARAVALSEGILAYELNEWEAAAPLGIVAGGWAYFQLIEMPVHAGISCVGEQLALGALPVFGLKYDVCTPDFSDVRIDVSSAWLQREYPSKDTGSILRLTFPATKFTDMNLTDDGERFVDSVYGLFCNLISEMREKRIDQERFSHTFTNPTFLRIPGANLAKVKIDSISFTATIAHRRETHRLKMANFAQLVLRQVNTNREWFFATSPSVIASLKESVHATLPGTETPSGELMSGSI
jgi:restriction endonuclease